MLTKTKQEVLLEANFNLENHKGVEASAPERRTRTSIEKIIGGQIHCHIYPTVGDKRCAKEIDTNVVQVVGLDVSQLTVGKVFDAVLVDEKIVRIEPPSVHPFDQSLLQKLKCITTVIDTPAAGIYDAVIAKYAASGEETAYRITSLTKMFEAQSSGDEPLRKKIFRDLKQGDSVNVWIDPSAPLTATGANARPVVDVKYLSVNYR